MGRQTAFAEANALQRALRRFGGTAPGAWLYARLLPTLDWAVVRATRGRYTATGLAAGLPVVLLTTTGARSGLPRTVPVLGFPVTDGLAVAGGNFGRTHHPAWYHNVRAHPDALVTVAGQTRPVRAEPVEGELRQRVWQEALRWYPGGAAYERASGRQLGVFLLRPRDADRAPDE